MSGRQSLGYTLIEVLVVVFIISIVASAALLGLNHNENKEMESTAREIQQLVTLAEEQAMLQPVVIGIVVHAHGLQFMQLAQSAANKTPHWLPLKDALLNEYTVHQSIQLQLKQNKPGAAEQAPAIIISTNGDPAPFTLYVGKNDKPPCYAIIAEANGQVSTAALC